MGSLDGVDGPGNGLEVIVNQLKIKSASEREARVSSLDVKRSLEVKRGNSVSTSRGSIDSAAESVSSAASSSSPKRKFSLWNRSAAKE
jgi:hypothetical protein